MVDVVEGEICSGHERMNGQVIHVHVRPNPARLFSVKQRATSNMPPQEPPTIPRREESSSMSEKETAMAEEDGDSDSGMDVQVRIMLGD